MDADTADDTAAGSPTDGADLPGIDEVADELYGLRPDEFVPARDEAVARARERGDRDLARAIGGLRRPTRPAWLANLLARHRAVQLDGLLGLAGGLTEAQRTLDGSALRALSTQRHQLVAAMAREAGRLAEEAADSVGESVLRDLQGILDAALARPDIAAEVRAGRLTRTVSYTGFGPAADPRTEPAPARPAPRGDQDQSAPAPEPAPDEQAERERAERERERAERERVRREEALAAAEEEEAAARERQEADESTRDDAVASRTAARDRVARLTAELDGAREAERAAATAAREAESAVTASARAAGAAASRTARARARLEGV